MLSLFGILNIGGESLSAERDAAAVAGQNLANVNNPAYADEQVQLEEAPSISTTSGQEGTGVEDAAITSLRNALLDAQIAAEGSVTGSLTAQQTALQQAEGYLNEQLSNSSSSSTSAASSSGGLTAALSGLFSALQTLSTDPSSMTDRQTVIQSAQQLAGQFNQVSSGLGTVTANLNAAVQNGVAAVNQDLNQIASLNQQIVLAQAGGGTANQLVDEREQTIENLAGYVTISTAAQADGALDVDVGGLNMISGGTVTNSLQTASVNGQLYMGAVDGGVLNMTSGSIVGAITARDGTVGTLQTSLNTFAAQLAAQVNFVYQNGVDLHGGTDQPFFTGNSASTIAVNNTLLTDPGALQASGTGEPGDNGVVLQMIQLASTPLGPLGNQTFSQYYAQTVGTFGSALQSVNEQLASSTSVAQMLATQRDSASGVNTDTELTNLLQFQKAYEASAELITTVNQMLETVLTMKTE
jgi:flagellar hook-associated protein 1 FlgK